MKPARFIAGLVTILGLLASPVIASASTLSLSPNTGTFNPGCAFSVAVKLDTVNVQTDGTDAIVLYDTSKLKVDSVTTGTLYPDYPISADDPTAGRISISGLASVSQPFTGAGTFATINFRVSPTAGAGATNVTFDFDPNNPGKTTDSNVVQRGTVADTLNGVTNGNYTIGTGTCGSAPITIDTSTSSGSGTIIGGKGGPISSTSGTPIKTLPNGGASGKTMVLTAIGGILTILGIVGLALL
jgi:hypothetical protein